MKVSPGSPEPLGATWDGGGVNFALFSASATAVDLCLFDSAGAAGESARVTLPVRTSDVWHGYVPGIRPGQLYGYRVHGPWDPPNGHRFDSAKVVLDPYARVVGRAPRYTRALFSLAADDGLPEPADSAADAPLAAVDDPAFDWNGDRPPSRSWADTVIYELHVKGFSALDAQLPPELRGTYLGVASDESLRYLLDLGVTAVELMPIHARADEWALVTRGLTNYWGYNTLSFFAPDARFAQSASPANAVREFKTMVRTLHAAGLEVILDVVYNHTAEGDHEGPTLSMRGIDNVSYYRLLPGQRSRYEDFTGCGSTLDLRTPRVRQLVLDSLRYWVETMHVDGFRFDLAPALARETGGAIGRAELFADIRQDPALARVKLIAEPWDASGAPDMLGAFPSGWSEWNARYRNAVRRFWRGDASVLPELATRLAGSSDLYGGAARTPQASVNYVTAHDGFTLADLVSFNDKHNEANGEQNRDGEADNLSWNCGVEGPTADPDIIELRARQRRNLLLTLFVSLGVPMVSGGDEVGRTQDGNNNAYCQDTAAFWTPRAESADAAMLLAFVKRLAKLRRTQPALRRSNFLQGRQAGGSDVVWLRPEGGDMAPADWADGRRRALGVQLNSDGIGDTLLVLFNGAPDSCDFVLPAAAGTAWECLLDTADPGGEARHVSNPACRLTGRSAVIFRLQSAAITSAMCDV